MATTLSKGSMSPADKIKFEHDLTQEFIANWADTRYDLNLRIQGVPVRAGATGYQFAGYNLLERFYRGDQWNQNEPPGASQRTDNYCAVIVDNVASLIFDDSPEMSVPMDDPTDDLQEARAEIKENLLWRVYKDNDYAVELDELAKVGSLFGDGFIVGPYMERVDDNGDTVPPDDASGTWKIRFRHVENPASIRLIFSDQNYKKVAGFIESQRMLLSQAQKLYGAAAQTKGITIQPSRNQELEISMQLDSVIPMVNISVYWTNKTMAIFINKQLLDYYFHNWGFVPIEYVKNIHTPNYPYGKSDLEDVLDPQLFHNRTNNDLANMLKWLSSINLWGKNLEGMQALVAGMSRIYSLPDDGELHAFERSGDPYISNTFVQGRRSALLDVSGLSEASLSSSQISASSGRALAMAFQGTIRKLNPRMKRYVSALQKLNTHIFKLYELYFPETKAVIQGDYRSEVFLPATILRNIVDTINKLQSGIISLDTAQKEAGVKQPRLEQRMIKKSLQDPVLGPQIARQPQLLPQLQEGQNQPGEGPLPGPGSMPSASPAGAVAASAQQAGGAAPVPTR